MGGDRLRIVLAFAACAFTAPAQAPQTFTFVSPVDGSEQSYLAHAPVDRDPTRAYPLVITLDDPVTTSPQLSLRRVFGLGGGRPPRALSPLPDIGFIVVAPIGRGLTGFRGIPEKDIYGALEDVKKRFPVDDDRVYLAGASSGGGAALWLALTRPDVWAAVAAACAEIPEEVERFAPNAALLPVHLFHGDRDPLIPVESARRWHKRLLDAGARVEYAEYPGVRHNCWDQAYKDADVFRWFAGFRRERHPDRVHFLTSAYHYDSASWLRMDSLTPGAPASVDAAFAAANRLEVRTSGVDAFTILLKGHPKFRPGRLLSIQVDGAALTLRRPQTSVSFTKTRGRWRIGSYKRPAADKRPGLEGPIAEAGEAPLTYVYGTADSAGPAEIKRRMEEAHRAADWSFGGRAPSLKFQVAADQEVGPRDLQKANLFLFGTEATNALLARWANLLPLRLNPGAADYGLAFVYLVEGRYVIVNSGLPFWTGAEESGRVSGRQPPPPYRVLETFGDFVLFKGSLENVIAEGRFDRSWNVPPEAAAKMRATGAVQVK